MEGGGEGVLEREDGSREEVSVTGVRREELRQGRDSVVEGVVPGVLFLEQMTPLAFIVSRWW